MVPGEKMLALEEHRSSYVLRVNEFCSGEGCFGTSEKCREGIPASGWNSGYEQASENPTAQADYADVFVVFGAFFEREFGGNEFAISMSADRLPPLAADNLLAANGGVAVQRVRDPINQAGLYVNFLRAHSESFWKRLRFVQHSRAVRYLEASWARRSAFMGAVV